MRCTGTVQEVLHDGVVIEYRSALGLVRETVAFEDMQTVIKPGVRRWWQKTSRIVAVVALVAVAAVLVVYAAGGGGQ